LGFIDLVGFAGMKMKKTTKIICVEKDW